MKKMNKDKKEGSSKASNSTGAEGKVNKDMTFAEIMMENPEAGFELMEMGLMCGGCPMAQFETIEQGCAVHGMDSQKVLKKLNKIAGGKSDGKE